MKFFMHVVFDIIVRNVLKIIGIVMLVSIICQIFTRLIGNPFPWTDEMARGSFIWYCFLGAALAMRQYAHLGIDYFRSKLGSKGQLICDIIVSICVIFFGAVVAYYGWKVLGIQARQRTPVMRISMQYFSVVIPICGALLFLQGIEFLVDYFRTLEPRKLMEEASLPASDEPLL